MKELYEKGLATHSASSFARGSYREVGRDA
jgi:hypothetical protein